jgi:imidazolonepropionase-like amidohydrolase
MDGSADFAGEAAALTPQLSAIKGTMNLRRHLSAGVTSIRDLGGLASCELANAVDAGLTPGPRVIAAGRALTVTGGHGHNVGFAREVDGPDEVRKAVREEIRAGAKAIKVVATGGVLTPGIDATFTAFTPEEIGAAVDEAHSWGRRVAAHAIGAPGILGAVRAGVDSVEHCNQLTAEAAREMVARGTFRGPTLSAVRGILGHPDDVPAYAVEKARGVHDDSIRGMKRALTAGVRHVVSTDAGTPFNPHGGAGREVAYLVEWGMRPLAAMIAATASGAELLGLGDRVGRVAPGFLADLALWNENPVEDPAALAKPHAVWKSGLRV